MLSSMLERPLEISRCGSFWKAPFNRLAAERAIEIISEASRHIPREMKSTAPHIPWRDIAGIGNILRHNYPMVAARIIRTIVHDDLGPLESVLREFLTRLPKED